MRKILVYSIYSLVFLILSLAYRCNEIEIGPSSSCSMDFPDSSVIHPKASNYQALIDRYVKKGLPGITERKNN